MHPSCRLLQHPFDLPELLHQRLACVKAPCGVHDQDLASPGPGRLDGVVGHRARVRPTRLMMSAAALGPTSALIRASSSSFQVSCVVSVRNSDRTCSASPVEGGM